MIADTRLPIDASSTTIRKIYRQLPRGSKAVKTIAERARYVPYRFLRPFFTAELQGTLDHNVNDRIKDLAARHFTSETPPLYKFVDDDIELHPVWFQYLTNHIEVVRGFCLWQLVQYLQRNNAHVPAISAKLFEPTERDLSLCRRFWRIAFRELGAVSCIYSNETLTVNSMSLDHFIPWSFVAHDQLWNIVPTTRSVNSSKGDKLPSLERYLSAFTKLQFKALKAVASCGHRKLIEDYAVLCKVDSSKQFTGMQLSDFAVSLEDRVRPQSQIATNMGFADNWVYRGMNS